MVRSTCVLLLLVCACDDEPAQSSPEVTHVAAPQPATEPTTEVEPTQEPPKPLSPPRPPRPSLDPNLDLVAALRPIERDEVDGGIDEQNERYSVSLTWPRFRFANAAIRDAIDAAIRPIAGDGTLYEDGDGEEDGRCESRLSRAGFVSVTCYTFRMFESDDEGGVVPGGCDIPVVGKTWHVVDGELLELEVVAAFTSQDDLRRICRTEVETLDLEPTNRGLCSGPLDLVLADEGVVVLPDEACSDASEGVLLSFEKVAPHYEPTSPLVRVMNALAAEG